MKSFTDNKGRTWTLEVTVATVKRVRALCRVELNSIVELDKNNKPSAELLERLSSDPVLLVDVLYAVCKPQADKLGITDEDFGEAMAGDAIEHATTALLEEVIDFFPEAKLAKSRSSNKKTSDQKESILPHSSAVFSANRLCMMSVLCRFFVKMSSSAMKKMNQAHVCDGFLPSMSTS